MDSDVLEIISQCVVTMVKLTEMLAWHIFSFVIDVKGLLRLHMTASA